MFVKSDSAPKGKIRRSAAHPGGGRISYPSRIAGRLDSLKGGGMAMPDGLRSRMEQGFSRDFSQVRLHTDAEAADLSGSIQARAFAYGNDIYFNKGQFSPESSEGQRLVAHELAHVVQGGEKVGRLPLDQVQAYDEEQSQLMLTIRNEFLDPGIISKDEDQGQELTRLMKNLDEPYFYQLLCTSIGAFRTFLHDYPYFFSEVLEYHMDSFILLAQNSPSLYLRFIKGNEESYASMVDELVREAKLKKAFLLYSRTIHKMRDADFHEDGDQEYSLEGDYYHRYRKDLLDDDLTVTDVEEIVPKLVHLNTMDFLAFVRKHEELYYRLGQVKYVKNLAGLWEYHVSAFKTLLESEPKIFFALFDDVSLANLGPRTKKAYQDRLDRIKRMEEEALKKREKSRRESASPSQLDVIEVLGAILTLDSVKGAFETGKQLNTFRKTLTTLRDELNMYLTESLSSATTKTMIFSWASILLAVKDLYDTCRQLDFDLAPWASSSVLVLKMGGFASTLVSEPHFLKFVAIRAPKVAAGLTFLGMGYAIGDMINLASDKTFGKKPGEALVDLFM